MNAQKLEFDMPEIGFYNFSVEGYTGVSSSDENWGSDEH